MLTLTGQCKYVKMALNSEKAMNRRSKRPELAEKGGQGLKALRSESR